MKPSEALAAKIDAACEVIPERAVVLEWILDEWIHYANAKWNFVKNHRVEAHDDDMRVNGWSREGFWYNQVLQYVIRCELFGVDEVARPGSILALKGRQAAMKMATTLLDGLASMIRVHGLPPGPGTSGEITPWSPSPTKG